LPNQAVFELIHAMKGVWRDRSSRTGSANDDLVLSKLIETCARLYPQGGAGSGFRYAVRTAYRNLGCELGEKEGTELLAAAVRLDAAFRQRTVKRTHICPLDQADELPRVTFGPNQVRSFSVEELDALVDPCALFRSRARWLNNIARFSRFQWLVVEENLEVAENVAARSLPWWLSAAVSRDYAAIAPHKSRFPEAVEDAIFALLLVPWEDCVAHVDVDWRPFRIPWVHTVTDDIFVSNPVLRDADTLSWEPDILTDAYGNEIEEERPTRLPLKDEAIPQLEKNLSESLWAQSTLVRGTRATRRPLQHFFVRAFLEDDIDEFLAHLITIEAALGLPEDHNRKTRPKLPGKERGASDRLKWRVGGLLHDDTASRTFDRLYGKRSDFIHGKRMEQISGLERVEARRLTRRCVSEILDQANLSAVTFSYDNFLHELLLRGRALDPAIG
jgi:hypothetical protein